MERKRVDSLSRLIAATGSRRGVLGGLMAIILQGQMPAPTEAQCRSKEGKHKRQCRRRERDRNDPGGNLTTRICPLLNERCTSREQCCSELTGWDCVPGPFVSTCQRPCTTERDCELASGTYATHCVPDAAACPFLNRCCSIKACFLDSDCPERAVCLGFRCVWRDAVPPQV